MDPKTILDAGAGAGGLAAPLAERYPQARLALLDVSVELLRAMPRRRGWRRWLGAAAASNPYAVCGRFERLPFPDDSFDLVVSNLALNWSADLPLAFGELRRVVRPGGLIMLTMLGPDTLRERRAARFGTTLNRWLPDMHDVGDMLAGAGFSAPVMDQEHLTLNYQTAEAFRRDLRYWGAVDTRAERRRSLCAPGMLRTAVSEVTLEVVYGHAWKPEAARTRRLPAGEAVIRFDRMPRK